MIVAIAVLLMNTPMAFAAPVVLILGDSISAGYGLERNEGWVALLRARLEAQGYGYRVINASFSGETTTGGLARLPRALKQHNPKIVILELGGNDGLRGLPLKTSRDNLIKLVELTQEKGAKVLLLGMKIPPNYGKRYAQGFEDTYRTLARQYKLAWVPFFLQEVILNKDLMQDDGLHPTAAAQPIMLKQLWPTLEPLLRTAEKN